MAVQALIGKQTAKIKNKENMVLVSMPFNEYFNGIYEKHIEPALEEFGFSPYRIKINSSSLITDEEFINSIKKARFMIADITNKSYDTCFESGFLKGLNRPVIYTAEYKEEIPSGKLALAKDILEWKNPADLKNKIVKRLLCEVKI